MSGVDWWQDPNSRAWDQVGLAGKVFNGATTITGGAERALEKKRKRGSDGGVIKDNGYIPAEIVVTLRLISQDDFDNFQEILAQIHPRKKGGIRKPVTIDHPAPNLIGIQQVYSKRIGLPQISNGIMSIAITMWEWFPAPKKAKVKTKVEGKFLVNNPDQMCNVPASELQAASGTDEALACDPDIQSGCLEVNMNEGQNQSVQDAY